MRRSLWSKRKAMDDGHIAAVTTLFGKCAVAQLATVTDAAGKAAQHIVLEGDAAPAVPEGGKVRLAPLSRLFRNEEFGYRTITVERPLRDADGNPVAAQKGKTRGKPMPDSSRRDRAAMKGWVPTQLECR